LLRNEYLVAENRILRNQIRGRVRLTDGERTTFKMKKGTDLFSGAEERIRTLIFDHSVNYLPHPSFMPLDIPRYLTTSQSLESLFVKMGTLKG